jgi:hypothetical protein
MDGSPAPEYYPGNDDVIITENVTLPFFKEVHTIGGAPDEFLEVTSENDTTTKAAIFNNGLWFPDTCMVMSVFFPENGREEKCAYCKTLTRDSVLSYLKGISYPCYLEFSQGDVSKRVRMYDYYRRPNQ